MENKTHVERLDIATNLLKEKQKDLVYYANRQSEQKEKYDLFQELMEETDVEIEALEDFINKPY